MRLWLVLRMWGWLCVITLGVIGVLIAIDWIQESRRKRRAARLEREDEIDARISCERLEELDAGAELVRCTCPDFPVETDDECPLHNLGWIRG